MKCALLRAVSGIAPSVTRKCAEKVLRSTVIDDSVALTHFQPLRFPRPFSLPQGFSRSRAAEIGCEAKRGKHVMCRGWGLWSIGSKPPLPDRPIPTPFRHTITHTYTSCLPTLLRQVHNAIYDKYTKGCRRDIGVTVAAARKRNSCLPARTRKMIRLSISSLRSFPFFCYWERVYRVSRVVLLNTDVCINWKNFQSFF